MNDLTTPRDLLRPDRMLLTAALGGLLGVGGCSDPEVTPQACDTSVTSAEASVTSSSTDLTMTEEKFVDMCDSMGGTMEYHSHCGGENSCQGMSYDTNTGVFSEHTCAGLNTCAGYSCVVCGGDSGGADSGGDSGGDSGI